MNKCYSFLTTITLALALCNPLEAAWFCCGGGKKTTVTESDVPARAPVAPASIVLAQATNSQVPQGLAASVRAVVRAQKEVSPSLGRSRRASSQSLQLAQAAKDEENGRAASSQTMPSQNEDSQFSPSFRARRASAAEAVGYPATAEVTGAAAGQDSPYSSSVQSSQPASSESVSNSPFSTRSYQERKTNSNLLKPMDPVTPPRNRYRLPQSPSRLDLGERPPEDPVTARTNELKEQLKRNFPHHELFPRSAAASQPSEDQTIHAMNKHIRQINTTLQENPDTPWVTVAPHFLALNTLANGPFDADGDYQGFIKDLELTIRNRKPRRMSFLMEAAAPSPARPFVATVFTAATSTSPVRSEVKRRLNF